MLLYIIQELLYYSRYYINILFGYYIIIFYDIMLQELIYSLFIGFIYDVYVVLYYDIYEWLIPRVNILFQEFILGLISSDKGLMYHNPRV